MEDIVVFFVLKGFNSGIYYIYMIPCNKSAQVAFCRERPIKNFMQFSKLKMLISNSYLIFKENKKFNIMMKY